VTAGGAAVEEVRELVAPAVWVSVRSATGARLMFRGRVLAPGFDPAVLLQSLTPHGWKTFAGLTPNPINHGFAYVYRSSPATVGYRYALRAVTLAADSWLSGASRVHSATILP
jgi:hypothetical protein